MEVLLTNSTILFIAIYQKYISPRKGFCCAHKALHNGMSCSEWGKRVVKRVGFYHFFPLMMRRFRACRQAYKDIKSMNTNVQDHSSEQEQPQSEYNPLKDKKNIECCIGAFPCLP